MTRRTRICLLGLLLSAAFLSRAAADDAWNPFKDNNGEKRPRASQAAPDGPPRGPDAVLPSMEGVGSRPWADQNGARPPQEWTSGRSDEPEPQGRGRTPGGGSAPGGSEAVQRTELQPIAGELPSAPGEPLSGAANARPAATTTFGGSNDARPAVAGASVRHQTEPQVLERTVAQLSLPVHSPALAGLWRQYWAGYSPAGAVPSSRRDSASAPADAIAMEALYRSGLPDELTRLAGAGATREPIAAVVAARVRVLTGDTEAGCADVKGLQKVHASLPKPLKSEFLLLAAYCGASSKDGGAAGLAADLLRAEGVDAAIPLAALDVLASGATGGVKVTPSKRATLMDYRFLELAGAGQTVDLGTAEPMLIVVLARGTGDAGLRIGAAEAAALLGLIRPEELAAAYRTAGGESAAPGAGANSALKRGQAFRAIETERTPMRKTRLVRGFLDDVRRASGPYLQAAAALAPLIQDLRPVPEIIWFAETAIEINLAAGRMEQVRSWAEPPSNERYGSHRHWLALADIATSRSGGKRGEALDALEQFAVRGRLAPPLMHRLVTVLDALDYQIPIPLWEAASRSPQPTSGYLPETGVLSQLKDAAQKKDQAQTILLAMRSLGPDSAETANLIALVDIIRGLKTAGFEAEARQVGVEALFAGWPRSAHN